MANVKISELTAITSSGDLADADIIPLVDSSDSTTKRAALSVLCSYFGGGGSSVWCTGTNIAYLLTDCVGIGTATPGTDIMFRVQGDSCYTGDLKIGGDVCIGGDDLFMGTNTSGHMLVADGTNFNPVAMSGDVGIDSAGATTIQATSVENSMLAGSIANAKLSNSSVSYGGISLALGATDATPAFNLCDATAYKTSNLAGTITNSQLAGSIANAKLANDSVSYGGVSVDLGSTDATPAFNLCDATGYPTSSLVGTITNAQLAGSIANGKLANDSVSYGGVSVDLGATDATPAFNLCDATAYKGDSALVTVGTVASGIWQGTAIATAYIAGTLASKTLSDPVLTGAISGAAMLDEDNMASDSATKVASQQSIKAYVDSVASGLDLKCSSHAATTANLSAAYNNGTSGVGATLTNSGTQAALSVDGQTMASGERVLVKDQSTAAQNGIYTVTTVGDGSTNWVLTRATDFDSSTEITSGAFTFVETGSSYADSGWVMTTDGTITVGTTSLAWSQFSGAGQITAGNGMTKSGNTLNVGAGSNLLVNADAVAMCAIVTGLTTVCATNFAGTLATAAQANVTSVGTLTALTVDNICLNGATIGHTSDTDLITLADGSVTIAGDLTVSGDDLTMATNTSGHILVADGTNYNPVAVSGDVTINGSGAVTIAATSVENSMLAGSIANAKLANDSVSYGGISLDLGGTDATPAFNLCDATAYKGDSALVTVGTITSGTWNGTAIANANLANDSVSYGGVSLDLGTTDATPAFNLCDATAYKGDSALVTVGTIASGTWNGTAIASAYLDSDTAHLSGTQTFSGAKTFSAAAQFSSTVTVGVDDTGYDVTLFGATSGCKFLWDESANKLIVTGDFEVTGTSTGTGTSFANDADNRVVTGTGSGLNGEANLTFDGSALSVTGTGLVNSGSTRVITEFTSSNTNRMIVVSADTETLNDTAGIAFNATASSAIGSTHSMAAIEGKVTQAGTLKGDLIFHINAGDSFTEAMRITSGSKVGIGTAAPANKLDVAAGASQVVAQFWGTTSSNLLMVAAESETLNEHAGIVFQATQGTSVGSSNSIAGTSGLITNDGGALTGDMAFYTNSGDSYAERMRITSNGHLAVGQATASYRLEVTNAHNGGWASRIANSGNSSPYVLWLRMSGASTTGTKFLQATDNAAGDGNMKFIVYGDGDVVSATNSYTSDAKLKQDIVDVRSYWDDFKAVRFRKFRFKSDIALDENAPLKFGVVAQEIEEVFPTLVNSRPDTEQQQVAVLDNDGNARYTTDEDGNQVAVTEEKAVDLGTITKTVKYSVLNSIGLKVIQELQARLEAAEAEIAILKG